jgi:iron(III) transport system ATP-binding protein
LDEPLAQVDTPLRAELLELIEACVAARRTTAVYVTHAWAEAMRIGRRIAVLKEGRIVRQGTPEATYWDLSNPAVARLTGPVVELPCEWLAGCLIACQESAHLVDDTPGDRSGSLVVRPQQLRVIEPRGANRWTPVESRPDGAGWLVTLRREGHVLRWTSPEPVVLGEALGIEVVGLG